MDATLRAYLPSYYFSQDFGPGDGSGSDASSSAPLTPDQLGALGYGGSDSATANWLQPGDPNLVTGGASYAPVMAPPADPNAQTVQPPSSGRQSFNDVYGSPWDPGGVFSPEVAFPMAGAWLSGNFGDGRVAHAATKCLERPGLGVEPHAHALFIEDVLGGDHR